MVAGRYVARRPVISALVPTMPTRREGGRGGVAATKFEMACTPKSTDGGTTVYEDRLVLFYMAHRTRRSCLDSRETGSASTTEATAASDNRLGQRISGRTG